MKTDVRIETQQANFKYRVSGLLVKNNKALFVKINDNSFYCLPGGHVELMENTKDAVIREYKEETGIDTKIEKLICIAENFFENKKCCHELGFFYLLSTDEDIKTEDFDIVENDNGELVNLHFKWLDIKNIEENIRPKFLKNMIEKQDFQFEHLIVKNDKII